VLQVLAETEMMICLKKYQWALNMIYLIKDELIFLLALSQIENFVIPKILLLGI
jgi:hypothetical protein